MEVCGGNSPARCFTGLVCALGILLTFISVLFFGQCVARATPAACGMHGGIMAVSAALTGFILIITGGICLAIYDCFRVELPRSTATSLQAEVRWKPRFLLAIPQAQAQAQAALLAEGGGTLARSDRSASAADMTRQIGLPA
jgi:hypothetical protein